MSNNTIENSNKRKSLGRGLGSLLATHAPESNGGQQSPPAKATTQSTNQLTNKEASPSPDQPSPAVATNQAQPVVSTPKIEKVIHEQGQGVTNQSPSVGSEARIWQMGVEKLKPSQFQPRQHFDKEKLEELANSIRAQGILQPIVARKLSDNAFEIIAGERRWRASQLAGLREVPVIIKTLSNKETLELAIIENVQREDLNPIEEAEAYFRLAQEFGLNQQQIAEKVGKERTTVANALRLLGLPTEVRDLVTKGTLSQGHAKVLLSLPEAQLMVKFARRAVEEGSSVRQLEKAIQAHKNFQSTEATSESAPSLAEKLATQLGEELQKTLGTKVEIDYSKGKGSIQIKFYSDQELNSIAARLKGDK